MTIYLTRQLAIEFERRIQTILPTMESSAKLDSETIYSFLNQYQQKYIDAIYSELKTKEDSAKLPDKIELILSTLFRHVNLTEEDRTSGGAIRSITYNVPSDYSVYVRSISKVDSTYNWKKNTDGDYTYLVNTFENQVNVSKLLETSHNKIRILRSPVAAIVNGKTPIWNFDEGLISNNGQTLCIIHDRYTNILDTDLYYYKVPVYFDVMTSTPCELPIDCFDDLVTGAVDLYMRYLRGGIRQQEEDGRRDRFNRRHAQREAEQNQEG